MKKSLFILATAAIALASCNNDVKIAENKTLGNNPQEIAFFSLAQKPARIAPARAIVAGETFPDNQVMYVTAYNTATSQDYFTHINFEGDNTNYWKGNPKQYWPLSPTTLNFIGITGVPKDNITWNTPTASSGASITWTHNATLADPSGMYDLMYATGQGTVAYGTGDDVNKLIYGNNVAMEYNHALAQVAFMVKVGSSDYATMIHVDKIVLDGMVTGATYTLTNSAYTATTAQSASGVWASTATANTDVPGSNAFASANMSTTLQADGAVVVPCKNAAPPFNSFTGFTVHFTMNGSAMTYHYTPQASEMVLEQGKKYIFNLTFKLTEIIIEPEVVDWDPQSGVNLDIPEDND